MTRPPTPPEAPEPGPSPIEGPATPERDAERATDAEATPDAERGGERPASPESFGADAESAEPPELPPNWDADDADEPTRPRRRVLRMHASRSDVARWRDRAQRDEEGRERATRLAERRARLEALYLALTDFVLLDIAPRYRQAGLSCREHTVAEICSSLLVTLGVHDL